ncbi:Uncharacterised protein [Mycobacteroides abscessus subsp. abscessus]|nr:Uncharacterised protein [Mycobacteroides abscessus subsp. abscessus]
MGAELPPSKFGTGYTYGGAAESSPTPFPPASPDPIAAPQGFYAPPPAQPSPVVDYLQTAAVSADSTATAPGFYTAPAAQPATPTYPSSVASGYPATTYPPATGPAGYSAKQQYAGTGGTAITAAVLSFIGVVYNAMYFVLGVGAIAGLVMMANSSYGYLDKGIVAGTVAMSIASIVGPVLLLVGGIQLLRHRLIGRRLIVFGSVLTTVGPAIFTLAIFGLTKGAANLLGSMGTPESASWSHSWNTYAISGLLMNGIPLLGALITIVLTLTAATRRWCEPIQPTSPTLTAWGQPTYP